VYLVSFDFYCPSKCGSYFCYTLYKIGDVLIKLIKCEYKNYSHFKLQYLQYSFLSRIRSLGVFLGLEIIPNEWNFRKSLRLFGQKWVHCNLSICTEQHNTENHRHDDRFINWTKMESVVLFEKNSNTASINTLLFIFWQNILHNGILFCVATKKDHTGYFNFVNHFYFMIVSSNTGITTTTTTTTITTTTTTNNNNNNNKPPYQHCDEKIDNNVSRYLILAKK